MEEEEEEIVCQLCDRKTFLLHLFNLFCNYFRVKDSLFAFFLEECLFFSSHKPQICIVLHLSDKYSPYTHTGETTDNENNVF